MSVGRVGKTTNWTDDLESQRTLAERESQWGEIPGRIVSFDPTKQTATIQPLYKPKFNGKPIDMPELLEVPVRFERAGGGGITYPVKAGDHVTLRPQMRSTENYLAEGNGAASDARSFNLSDMEAHLSGGEDLNNPVQGFDNANTHVRFNGNGQFGLRGNEEGKFSLTGSQGELVDLLIQLLDILSVEHSVDPITGPEPLQNQAIYAELSAKFKGMKI